jgi:hypothetical protein
MPERKTSVVRVSSEAVQGDGSWVDIQRLKWGEIKRLSKTQKEIQTAGSEGSDVAIRVSDALLAEHVMAWNWVAEDGSPLPQPHGNAEVMDDLTNEEFEFLADAIAGSEDRRKN